MFIFLLLSIVKCSEFTELMSNRQTCPKQKGSVGDYKMNVLANFWIGTACLRDKPGSGVGPVRGTNAVTIHGLWPGNNASSWPECCNNSYPFKPAEISGIADLSKNWVSTQGPDNSFYTHEWEKHGTCAMDLFHTERDYFSSVVNLNKRLNIAGIFRAAGIIAGNRTYSKNDVKTALRRGLGHDVLLECAKVNGISMLNAIYTCIDHSPSLNVQECTSDYKSRYEPKCPSSFILPAIPDSCYK
ncbi:putative Ribonuclease 1 [Monocercomonoides exilis]|uniref:putative Ribonuclease 1 n=1 Tax=Monocercomonoides exilis TaxID=2049356 RepID=UPI00355A32E4|nr:putative Ribonuclease 1 [Monocercomonoides exilis]|eukprot:MONOS_2474.1-p1 / transcript=MONOS_2474.1 / gene=MONOS_2474 / organism=Monocercomonoides_exilis_PA203 / gene_product=Ribonuclease 1 / transcript_product=Ribonuclease 1 / location=Mono_scaffold00051:104468-105196(-) / protein_length=242 / sequence_SO=supercontig / SO=protein_coding / is_pseudo=false